MSIWRSMDKWRECYASYWTTALDRVEWSASHSGHFSSRDVPFKQRFLGWYHNSLGMVAMTSFLTFRRIETRSVQLVIQHFHILTSELPSSDRLGSGPLSEHPVLTLPVNPYKVFLSFLILLVWNLLIIPVFCFIAFSVHFECKWVYI